MAKVIKALVHVLSDPIPAEDSSKSRAEMFEEWSLNSTPKRFEHNIFITIHKYILFMSFDFFWSGQNGPETAKLAFNRKIPNNIKCLLLAIRRFTYISVLR